MRARLKTFSPNSKTIRFITKENKYRFHFSSQNALNGTKKNNYITVKNEKKKEKAKEKGRKDIN